MTPTKMVPAKTGQRQQRQFSLANSFFLLTFLSMFLYWCFYLQILRCSLIDTAPGISFSKNQPLDDSFIESRCRSVFGYVSFHVIFLRPLIGPQVTWSDPGLSLAKPVGLHHLQFPDQKSKARQSKASPSPRRARPSPAISWENRILLHFFHQEIASEGWALRGDRLALLCLAWLFFIRKLQVMDVLFELTNWLVCLLEGHIHHLQFLAEKFNSIGPTIRIDWKILCLPYAGFLKIK